MNREAIAQQGRTSAASPTNGLLQRKCACGAHTSGGGTCASCTKASGDAPESVARTLDGSGRPLDSGLRDDMGSRFGHDFTGVRVHQGADAERSARDVDALAYTVGKDVVFGAGQYAPATNSGRSLLAHELAHVVQQSGGPAAAAGGLKLGAADSIHERQADEMSRAAAGHKPIPSHAGARTEIMRADRSFSLTFDDGPHAATLNKGTNRTEKILDALKSKGIKAGFFIQTAALDEEGHEFRGGTPVGKILVKRMADEGHKIGIHTGGKADHEDHPVAQKAGRLEGELTDAKAYVKNITGSDPTYVRPPLWDMDGDQGQNKSLAVLKKRIKSEMLKVQKRGWTTTTPSPSIVVLYHDVQKGTADNIDAIIDGIKTTTEKISDKKDKAVFVAP
ncbi:MAG: DUF4157 domain-containing protein [Alphaproteobacteria bacterium]|nr:MAG: DUF4157 domain-containing protein [Alphaproteobacteria bacterium]